VPGGKLTSIAMQKAKTKVESNSIRATRSQQGWKIKAEQNSQEGKDSFS
jgi:hypothetical protein